MDQTISKTPREELLDAIQNYAEEWAAGKARLQSIARTALYLAIDRLEASGSAFNKDVTCCKCHKQLKSTDSKVLYYFCEYCAAKEFVPKISFSYVK